VPKTLYFSLGGFDEHYIPAYCEDADLALKIRASGYDVIYQPLSTIIHYEGVTSGTDTSSGIKSYQVANMKKMFERWKDRLASHEPGGTLVDQAKDRGRKQRVLIVDVVTPTPDRDAGSLVMANIMLTLNQLGMQVTFVPADNYAVIPTYTADLQRAGIEALYHPTVASLNDHLQAHGSRYNFIMVSRPETANRHLADIKRLCPGVPIVYYVCDLHYLRMSREAEVKGDAALERAALLMKDDEFASMAAAEAVIVHNSVERDLILEKLPGKNVIVLPLIMDIRDDGPGFAHRRDIAFVGGYQHLPNVDAVEFFVREVFPLVRKAVGDVKFYAFGSNPPESIKRLADENVKIPGFIADLCVPLDRIRVGIAPLRFGAGAKGKVATSLSLGLPMVVTPVASEGMGLTDGHDVCIAETAATFAEAIIRIYENEGVWTDLSNNGRKRANTLFGPESAKNCLTELLTTLNIPLISKSDPIKLLGPTGQSVIRRNQKWRQ
jgi:O-antigen biosynthesis protein